MEVSNFDSSPNVALATEPGNAPLGWVRSGNAPWRRCAARLLDVLLLAVPLLMLIGVAGAIAAPLTFEKIWAVFDGPGGPFVDLLFTVFVSMLVNAAIMALFGTTPGKVIFGISVERSSGAEASFVTMLAREFDVWWRGWACGIPIISLITLALAKQTLHDTGSTKWDTGRFVVSHRASGTKQTLLNILGVGLIVAGRLVLRYLERLS